MIKILCILLILVCPVTATSIISLLGFLKREKSTGTGLGLAIVHNIMEAHAGSVSVESTPGVATTFTLFFPEREKGATDD